MDDKELKRFHSKYLIDTNGCWIWVGAVDKGDGRGRFHHNGKTCGVNRVAYEHFHGAPPPDKAVVSGCGNRLCVNPEHLQLMKKGRRKGCRNRVR